MTSSGLRLVSSSSSSSALSALATSGSPASRAAALLGDNPTLTFVADEATPDSCCTLRMVRHGAVWVGVVSDRALFADRVRMGMTPRFTKGDADVVTVAGSAVTRLLGRLPTLSAELQTLVQPLLGPWGGEDAVVVEITPSSLVLVSDEDGPGSIPRT